MGLKVEMELKREMGEADECRDFDNVLQKPLAKENTKPVEIKLHTQQRAVKRAIFNYSVATKLYLMEQQKKQVEKLQKLAQVNRMTLNVYRFLYKLAQVAEGI
ncbi:hypothetical protein RJ640_015467 [Escallonia rubra]|uniref:TPX2 C-terminal domain-containing protein n=1 Tax=Escallonia rubra TaxID=112253 RepID=A0AA88RKX1_9ASTE|nr:hypothetical protein RJ640_015467 [Escallonia rubra]